MDLFDIVEQGCFPDLVSIENEFKLLHPGSSLDNAIRYLIKILTDCLIQLKIRNDPQFKILQGLMRVNVLKERSLNQESFKELKKIKELAIDSQSVSILPLINRLELNYLSNSNFPDLCEKKLVEMQMKATDTLQNMRNIHEHYSLYELLKFRMINLGKVLSEEDKKHLNDLVLSEIGLVTGRIKNNFDSQKLHLLFHSFFFTDIGDFKSALKTFYELNRLFEQNPSRWSNPPLDYLSALDGILDSLRTIKSFNDMPFYIEKMAQLSNNKYPEYFRIIVEMYVLIYNLSVLTGTDEYDKAVDLIQGLNPLHLKIPTIADYEKQSELFFYLCLSYFGAGNLNESQKYINQVVLIGKINYRSMIYKASRLLNLIIHYECNNLEYLDYEIRSYKRLFQNKGKLLQTEKLIFKIIQSNDYVNTIANTKLKWSKIESQILLIESDKYEMQLRKYFDFIGWIRNKKTNKTK